MRLTFEQVFRSTLLREGGDEVTIGSESLDYQDMDALPFLFDIIGTSYVAQVGPIPNIDYGIAHYELINEIELLETNEWNAPQGIAYKVLNPKFKSDIDIAKTSDWRMIYDSFITGRLWLNSKIIGVWSSPVQTLRIMPTLLQLYPMIKPDWIIDFDSTEQGLQMTIGELLAGKTTVTNARSKEDIAMLQQQHIVGQLKKFTGAMQGSVKNANVSDKAGFKSTAAFNNKRIVGDSVQHGRSRIT